MSAPAERKRARRLRRLGASGPRAAFIAGLVFAVLLLAAGCSIDYEAAEEEQPANIPDTVAVTLVHKIHKDGRLSLQLEAARAETYNKMNQTILTDAHFTEFNDKGEKATEGEGGKVVFHSDTENAEISGKVRVHSTTEKGDVTADTLSWENKTKLLTAPPGEKVTIHKDDGSFLSGAGFTGDFRKRRVTFSHSVQGLYVWEEKK
ncbi:MAG: LPS export ABC transporter periplasmic protein LptC [Spirochaetia bacterium]